MVDPAFRQMGQSHAQKKRDVLKHLFLSQTHITSGIVFTALKFKKGEALSLNPKSSWV